MQLSKYEIHNYQLDDFLIESDLYMYDLFNQGYIEDSYTCQNVMNLSIGVSTRALQNGHDVSILRVE